MLNLILQHSNVFQLVQLINLLLSLHIQQQFVLTSNIKHLLQIIVVQILLIVGQLLKL